MRPHILAVVCCTVMVAACAKSDKVASDTAMADAAMASPAAATITLADVAGTWNQNTMAETGDSILTTSVLKATADTTGWTLALRDRAPMPVRVTRVDGDSIVTLVGPYSSVLRKGTMVTTRSVLRLKDGKLMGTVDARYSTTGPDSLRRLRSEGVRAP